MGKKYFETQPEGTEGRPPTHPFAYEAGEFGKKYEFIFAYLALLEADGLPRLPGRLTIFTNGSGASVCLTDGQTGNLAFYDAPSVDLALEGLEYDLENHRAKWKPGKSQSRYGSNRSPHNGGTGYA